MVKGGFYVKENDTHGYSKLRLLPEASALVPEGLFQTPHGVSTWKSIIRQLEDQLAEGATEPEVIAAQAMGLSEFALRVLKTPYATTPMGPAAAQVNHSVHAATTGMVVVAAEA